MPKNGSDSEKIKSLISSGNVEDIREAIRLTREKIANLKSQLGKEDESLDKVSELGALTVKSGKKLFGTPKFEKIKQKLEAFNKLGDSQLEEKKGVLDEIFTLANNWYKDHGKSKSKDNLARKAELDELVKEMRAIELEVMYRLKARIQEQELYGRIKSLKKEYDKIKIEDITARMDVLGKLDIAIYAWYKFDLGQPKQKKEIEAIMEFSRDMTPALMVLDKMYESWEEYQNYTDQQPDIKANSAKSLAAKIESWTKDHAGLSPKDAGQIAGWLETLKSDWTRMQKATAFEIGVAFKSYHYGKEGYDVSRRKEMLAEIQTQLRAWRKRYPEDVLGGLNQDAQMKIEVVDVQVQDELGRIVNLEMDKESKKESEKMEKEREAKIPAETWFHALILSYDRYQRIDPLDYAKRLTSLDEIEEDLEKWGTRYAKKFKGNTMPLQRINSRVEEDREDIQDAIDKAKKSYNKISQLYNGKFKDMKKEEEEEKWEKTQTQLRKQINSLLEDIAGVNHPEINSMRCTLMELKLWMNRVSEEDLLLMLEKHDKVIDALDTYENAYKSSGGTKLEERLGKIQKVLKQAELWIDTYGSSKDETIKSLVKDMDEIKFRVEGEIARIHAYQLAEEIKELAKEAKSKKVAREKLAQKAKDKATWKVLESLPLSEFQEVSKLLHYEEEADPMGEKDFHLPPELEALVSPGGTIPETLVSNASLKLVKKKMKFKNPHEIVFLRNKGDLNEETETVNEEATYDTIAWHDNNYIYLNGYKKYHIAAIHDTYLLESDTWESADPDAIPLFGESGKPTIADVRQGDIGDCYLLAAIGSLVKRDPEYVKNMFSDSATHVSVRLYDFDEPTPGTFNFTPKVYKVHRSVPKDSINKNNGLWVRMLEKAYVAGECNKKYSNYKFKSFAQIEGGFSDISMMVLVGEKALRLKSTERADTDVSFKDFSVTGIEDNGDARVVQLPWSKAEKEEYATAKTSGDYTKLRSYQIFIEDFPKPTKAQKMVKIWMDYVAGGAIERLYSTEYFGDYAGELTYDDFEDLFNAVLVSRKGKVSKKSLNQEVADCMLKWLKKEKLFPGRRGSGTYSQLQLELFEKIKKGLSKGKLITLDSKTTVGKVVEGTGSSGGEGLSKGLAGGHAYTVLDTNEELGPTGLKEILVRNPWGSYGQENLRVNKQLDELMTEKQKASDRFGRRRAKLRRKLEKSGDLWEDTINTDTFSVDSYFKSSEKNKKYEELVAERIEEEYQADKGTYDGEVALKVNEKLDDIVSKRMEEYTEAKAKKDANEKGRKRWEKLTKEVRDHEKKELTEKYLQEKKQEIRKKKNVDQWVQTNKSKVYWKVVYEELLKLAEDSLNPKKLPEMKQVFEKFFKGEALSPQENTLWNELLGDLNDLKKMKDIQASHEKEAKDTGKFWLPLSDLTLRFRNVEISG